MARFQTRKKTESPLKAAASLFLFAAVIVLFLWFLSTLSGTADSKEKASLENAISRDITYCYATEGAYPESLDYIKKNYGLVYDENKFFVDYTPRGENIFPDVTIIKLEEGK